MTELPLKDLDEQTQWASAPGIVRRSPAYLQINALGWMAVDGLLSALPDEDHTTFALLMLLRDITGQNPVPQQDQGHVDKEIEAWLAWGKTLKK